MSTAVPHHQAPPLVTAAVVADVLRSYRFRFSNEDQLQEGLSRALTASFPDSEVRREVQLGPNGSLGRVDVMVDRVAVEAKVAGGASDVRRQLHRYAAADEVDELVLVTNQVMHGSGSGEIDGKAVEIVSIVGSQL